MPCLRADAPIWRCVICDSVSRRTFSTRRSVRFAGRVRRFTRCTACGSRSLNPMPSEAELAILYGAEYNNDAEPGPSIEGDPRADDWLLDRLAIAKPDRFVDFGCGSGSLLARVAATGVEALGFDLDPAGVAAASSASGCAVYMLASVRDHQASADMVHIGDVLEHVPDPDHVLRQACSLLRPGGVVLAQGPLEANLSFFNAVLSLTALARRGRPVESPPYHVHLVTARGQQALFERVGLMTEEFDVSDVAWPAPARWTRAASSSRILGLFILRRLSTAVRLFAPGRMSNRFRYRGRLPG
jgi:2-polyprenyl-3-methyl-5-hydroxy-6-metoxy-1,4-benzoquinol methylase